MCKPLDLFPRYLLICILSRQARGIAQLGSAPGLGDQGCRGFKSLYPDQVARLIWPGGQWLRHGPFAGHGLDSRPGHHKFCLQSGAVV